MKKLKLLFLSFIMLAFATTVVLADTAAVKQFPTTTVAATPASITPTQTPVLAPSTNSWADYFASPAGVIALIVLITGFATKNLPSGSFAGVTFTHWASYIIAVGLCFVGQWQQLGIFHGLTLGATALDGIAFGLTANGVSTLPIISGTLQAIGAKNKF